MSKPENPPAFPNKLGFGTDAGGMTLREYYIGQALANQAIVTGTEPEWRLQQWFGDRTGINRGEIAAKQAAEFADALLAERERQSS